MNQKALFPEYQDFTASAWKSVVVKSLRIGWVRGLEEAQKHLSISTIRSLLICSIFEDIFPTRNELSGVTGEIKRIDWMSLCSRDTHHGKGYTNEFCDYERMAVQAAKTEGDRLFAIGRKYDLWLPPRSYNCFWTWLRMKPTAVGRRDPDLTEWTDMPIAMLDAHTQEGRSMKQFKTIVSGHYDQHRKLGRLVNEKGWDYVRKQVHG